MEEGTYSFEIRMSPGLEAIELVYYWRIAADRLLEKVDNDFKGSKMRPKSFVLEANGEEMKITYTGTYEPG